MRIPLELKARLSTVAPVSSIFISIACLLLAVVWAGPSHAVATGAPATFKCTDFSINTN
jgi:hypothetical protein